MRLAGFCLLLLPLAGICAAQDTNFPTCPQYLITYGSPLFLHSIATPSMNLDSPLPSVPPPVIETSTADLSSSPAPTPNPAGLASILWGAPTESVIEITSEEPTAPLPASIAGAGVTGMTDASSLRDRGYGVSLGETAALWKAHTSRAKHVYTNSDLERLHGG